MKTLLSQRAYKYCRTTPKGQGSSEPCYIYTKDSLYFIHLLQSTYLIFLYLNLTKKYVYPADVCSNEEPILDDVIDPEEWTGFRVERKSADSNEARRLLGNIIIKI